MTRQRRRRPTLTAGQARTKASATLSTQPTAAERAAHAEQEVVDDLYGRLDEVRERTRGALLAVQQAPTVPTPAGRAEREAFLKLHSERLQQLDQVEDRLVFGRLDVTPGAVGGADHGAVASRYIGRIGLADEQQHQMLLDWRAPAAAAFYQATAARPEGVLRRRHLTVAERAVTAVDDEVLDAAGLARAVAAGPGHDLDVVTGDGALMSALTAHRTGRMRDIVATLQGEQDRIVRAPLEGVLVVQGGPGTGKTAVALHRAAYLLYTHRERIARRGVLVVGPSPVFLDYIEQVLPSLGETGVVLATPGQLMPGVDTTAEDRDEVAALKGDLRMAKLVLAAVKRRQRLLDHPVEIDADGDRVVLHPKAVSEARARARQSGRPHNEARAAFVRVLLADLARQVLARRRGSDDEELPEIAEELRRHPDVRRTLNLLWMPLTATGFVRDLLTKPHRLQEAGGGLLGPKQQALLLRDRDAPWTVQDVPLLDEAAELIGPDPQVAAGQARADAERAAQRAEALEFSRRVLQEAGADAASMLTPEMLADRFTGGADLAPLADRARADRSWVFGHAVVDEAQELSPMQWRMIARRVPSRSMTVVGDVAQTGSAAGASSWAQALDPLMAGRWRVEDLTVNYRTPGRIMDRAVSLARAHRIRVEPPVSAREGDHDPRAVPVGGDVAGAVLKALLQDDEVLGGGRLAVVTARAGRDALARELVPQLPAGLAARTQVLTVTQAKGLEFDAVVVVEPADVVADGTRGANDLYVAMTRPTQRLTLVHARDLPEGLR